MESWIGDHPETQERLGGRDWIRRAPSLLQPTTGDEVRGNTASDAGCGCHWMRSAAPDFEGMLHYTLER
jgi:hypothetical protein